MPHFFKGWKEEGYHSNLLNNSRISSLELYVTSECNQKCEYCYLQRFGEQLYPENIRDHKTILHNLDILLKFVLKKWPKLINMDIFSGEIVGTCLFYEIMDKIIDYKKQGASYSSIIVPSNFSFLLSDTTTTKIQEYIDKCATVGIKLILSASVDGLLIDEDARPLINTNKKRDEEFYDKVFQFCVKNDYCLHPMISAFSIEKWIDNYKWFIEKMRTVWFKSASKNYDFRSS